MKEFPPLPFARPFIGKEEEDAVLHVLRSGWLTTGKEAAAFEKEFAYFLANGSLPQTEDECAEKPAPLTALAVNSATSGLHLALEALGVGEGDVVLVPSLTFASTAEVARYLGAEAAFVDVAPHTFHISPEAARQTAANLRAGKPAYGSFGPKGKPKAIIPVHYGGVPCNMDSILALAREYGMGVVEDSAHCFPSFTEDGRAYGALGDVGVFSFYATKTITTGEGGMVVSGNPALCARMATMRLHGIDRPAWSRYTDVKSSWYYEIADAGYKYNLPDILAALGRVQLSRAISLLNMRRHIAAMYDKAFSAHPALEIPSSCPADARHLYPLRVRDKNMRTPLVDALKEAGIGVSVHFIPLHTMPYYKKRYALADEVFPCTMDAFSREVSLPIWAGMTGGDVERVIEAVCGFFLK
ncbi:MAG: DegT/DnrJ/EryC1/StrS aminotransferase family protein [Spirochaetaceae bacterium]|jgi:dTDP-4-amino-4,6-dideoxygalactose transaminase|nr:DegT/DnrJ/EryC1/StrS aminotransferase family protein [Spirochaetaceae bacterium]